MRDCIAAAAAKYDIEVKGQYCLKVVHGCNVSVARRWLHRVCSELRHTAPHWAQHLWTHTRIVNVQGQTWRSRLFDCPKSVRGFRLSEVANLSQSEAEVAEGCADMKRHTADSRLLQWEEPSNAAAEQKDFLQECLRTSGVSSWLTRRPGVDVAQLLQDEPAEPRLVCSSRCIADHVGFAEVLAEVSANPSLTITVEDKDPSRLWVQETRFMMWRWLAMIIPSPRWKIFGFRMADVVSFYRSVVNVVLPRNIARNMIFTEFNVPYIYPTVKSKCYGTCNGRTCKICPKPLHSCFRNICSFVKFPGRRHLRYVSRAIRFVLLCSRKGWFFESLSTAHGELSSKQKQLYKSPGRHCCVDCKCALESPSIITIDAGQAYESIPVWFVLRALDRLWDIFDLHEKDKTVTVHHASKAIVNWGGDVRIHSRFTTVLYMSVVMRAIRLMLHCRIFQLADLFIVQTQGLPIGGPLSSVLLDVALADEETRFDLFDWNFIAARCGLRGPRSRYIGTGRIADDTIMFSYVFCPCCLMKMITSIYKQCKFDDSTKTQTIHGVTHAEYLDFIVQLSFDGIHFSPFCKNADYVVMKPIDERQKNRFPPLYGTAGEARSRLRVDLQGRLARDDSFKSTFTELVVQFLYDFGELIQLEYSLTFIQEVWSQIREFSVTHQAGLRALRILSARFSSKPSLPRSLCPPRSPTGTSLATSLLVPRAMTWKNYNGWGKPYTPYGGKSKGKGGHWGGNNYGGWGDYRQMWAPNFGYDRNNNHNAMGQFAAALVQGLTNSSNLGSAGVPLNQLYYNPATGQVQQWHANPLNQIGGQQWLPLQQTP